MSKMDILYLAGPGRARFTEVSLNALTRNTDWSEVGKLFLYYDRNGPPGEVVLGCGTIRRSTYLYSPVAVMADFLERRREDPDYDPTGYFVKIDNDFVVCPRWLAHGMNHLILSKVDLMGIEPRYGIPSSRAPVSLDGPHHLSLTQAEFIGGIGFMKYSAFENRPLPDPERTYFGFTKWQMDHPEITKVWIDPPLPVFLLDHLPFSPWCNLSQQYVSEGIQRNPWGFYLPEYSKLWEWWDPDWEKKVPEWMKVQWEDQRKRDSLDRQSEGGI